MTINSQKRLFLIILTDLFFYLFRSNMHKLVPLFWQLSGRLIGELFFLRNINKLKGKKKCMLIRWKLKTKFYLCWTSLETIGFCCDNCLFEVLMEIQITRNLNFFFYDSVASLLLSGYHLSHLQKIWIQMLIGYLGSWPNYSVTQITEFENWAVLQDFFYNLFFTSTVWLYWIGWFGALVLWVIF